MHLDTTVLGSSLGQDVTMFPGGSVGHADLHDAHSSMGLRHQHGGQLAAQTTGLPMALSGNRSHRQQPWLPCGFKASMKT